MMKTLLHTIPGAPPELTTTDLISWESGVTALKTAQQTLQGRSDNLVVEKFDCQLIFANNTSSRDAPLYNLASELYSARWEEGVYRLYEAGHCHTFNPENVSHSDLKGQHYFNLGKALK